MRFAYCIYCLIPVLLSCITKETPSQIKAAGGDKSASFFHIEDSAGFKILTVVNPLDYNKKEKYLLHKGDMRIPTDSYVHQIKLPVTRVACISTSHIGFLIAIQKENTIVGSLNPELIYSPKIRKSYEASKLISIGAAHVDKEKLLQLDVDLIFMSVFDAEGMKEVEYMRNLGMNVILISEFLEKEPLKKTKWIQLFSCFYDSPTIALADSLYNQISDSYEKTKSLALHAQHRPQVMTGLPWKGNWYIPGGKSFQSTFLEHAAASYILEDDKNINSVIMDFEQMLMQGMHVPYWINVSNAKSLEEIAAMDHRFAAFKSFKEGQIYNNNARLNAFGGNDYWESAVVRPDLVLKDLVKIFHPGILPEHSFIYYQKLE